MIEPKRFSRAGSFSAIVLEMAGLTVAGLFFGSFIDKQLSTSPVFLVLFITLGFFTGVYRLVKSLNRWNGSDD